MPHHARAAGWTSEGSRMWFHRCDQCRRRRLVGWYYEVYPPLSDDGCSGAGWWWACADCLVSIVSDQLEEQSCPCKHLPYETLVDDLERCHEERLRVLAGNERLTQALTDWKREMADCRNCHYHRHIARDLVPHVLANGRAAIRACAECREDL